MENTAYGIIKNTLETDLGISAERISEDSRFIEDLGISSLDIVIHLSHLEDELGIEVPDESLLTMKTVGTAAVRIAELAGIGSGTTVMSAEEAPEEND